MRNFFKKLFCNHNFKLIGSTYRPFSSHDDGDLYEITTFITQCPNCGKIKTKIVNGK